ncbi:MAG: DUF1028 domain-containing protein [Alphaproteobacteria bacterium]|nr:DUF1028 domain-containing protein [Alphaproteobacteria bacterium]
MTFSIVARCKTSGQFGMAISSSSPAVAARCAHVRAAIGAVASQNITDPELGPLTLDALAQGRSAAEALALVLKDYPHAGYRQLLVVDRQGQTAIHSGSHVLGLWGEARGEACAAGGNLLASASIPELMVKAFEKAAGTLAHRLMAALEAGLAAGGEAGPVHSAGLKVADRLSWPFIDLRMDWSDTPIADLRAALDVYEPQANAYVQRALAPGAAPSFGVAGDR